VGTSRAPGSRDPLRALLADQADGLTADALDTGGQVPAERLDALARLARLADLRDASTKAPRRRWPVILVALGTLACVSLLLFARVPSTEVELDLRVSELSFVVPTEQVITDAMNVVALGVNGLTSVELPGTRGGPGTRQPTVMLRLAADRAGQRRGTASLDPIAVPARTHVSLRQTQGSRQFCLGLRGALSELAASLQGPVRIVLPGDLNEVRDFPFPRRLAVQPDSQEVTLDFETVESGVQQPFRSPVPAESLSLSRIDQFQTAGGILVPRVSTIRSGTVFLESIDGRARPLRLGEGLTLPRSRGEIRELLLGDSAVTVRFHGTVWDMSVGTGGARRSLMPTLFEWLSARHGLSLLWGATAYMIGLFTAVAGWWKRPA
jgi:hypothetical protein